MLSIGEENSKLTHLSKTKPLRARKTDEQEPDSGEDTPISRPNSPVLHTLDEPLMEHSQLFQISTSEQFSSNEKPLATPIEKEMLQIALLKIRDLLATFPPYTFPESLDSITEVITVISGNTQDMLETQFTKYKCFFESEIGKLYTNLPEGTDKTQLATLVNLNIQIKEQMGIFLENHSEDSFTSFPGSDSDHKSGSESDPDLDICAQDYKEQYKNICKDAHTSFRINTIEEARLHILNTLKISDILIIGEGSHEDNTVSNVMFNSMFANQLRDSGVTHLFIEHLYPEHIEKLVALPQVVLDHLNTHTYLRTGGVSSPALHFVSFLQNCISNGLKLIALDSDNLYTKHKQFRLPLLNQKVISSINEVFEDIRDERNPAIPPKPIKAVIYIGAAHTNSHNSGINKASSTAPTPGITEALRFIYSNLKTVHEILLESANSRELTSSPLGLGSINEDGLIGVEA
jgi:hypothetical protein